MYDTLSETKRTRIDFRLMLNLVTKMQNCSVALNHMHYQLDLNAVYTLESIILPIEFQGRWVGEAD